MFNVITTIGKGQSRDFPKLMKHKDGTIVLFETTSVGICLAATGLSKIGKIYIEWNMTDFTDFNEPITIQNA